ncbi:TPA: hypothetical protein ACN35C_004798, partial [Vibrio parahaemolyticus]
MKKIQPNYFCQHYGKLRNQALIKNKYACQVCGIKNTQDYPLLIQIKQLKNIPFNYYQVNDVDLVCRDCIKQNNCLDTPQEGWQYLAEIDLGHIAYRCEHIKETGNPCNQQIRYQEFLYHPLVGVKIVGRDCTKKLIQSGVNMKDIDVFEAVIDPAYAKINDNVKAMQEKELKGWTYKKTKTGKEWTIFKKSYKKNQQFIHHLTIEMFKSNKTTGLKVFLTDTETAGKMQFSKGQGTYSDIIWLTHEKAMRLAMIIKRYREVKYQNKNENGIKQILISELNLLDIKIRIEESKNNKNVYHIVEENGKKKIFNRKIYTHIKEEIRDRLSKNIKLNRDEIEKEMENFFMKECDLLNNSNDKSATIVKKAIRYGIKKGFEKRK